MRKTYLDNIRWVTVVLVVIYHVQYMYNAEGVPGTLGKITSLDVQYYDVYMYAVFPWFMMVLFIVSGICSRLYLENHTDRDFVRSRTTRLLVPSTIGIVVFQFIQGYINMSFSGAGDLPVPGIVKHLIAVLSGIGVLWYIQTLWVFSMILVLIRKIEKDRLFALCKKTNLAVIIVLAAAAFGMGQILNTPIITVYRLGLYLFAFLAGYFIFSHDEVIEILKKWFALFAAAALALGIAFCIKYFGTNYAVAPVNRTLLFHLFAYFACMAVIGGFARFFDLETPFTNG